MEMFKETSETHFLILIVNETCLLVSHCSFVLVNFTFLCDVFEFVFVSSCLSLPMGSVSVYSTHNESEIFRSLGHVGADL